MKEVISNFPILSLPGFSKQFVLECGASGEGIGVVLKQVKQTIDFNIRNVHPL